jgi:single-stranded DNA-binding protein
MILVRGKVVTRTWVDDQQHPRVQVQVEADSVGHDLAFGWSRFIRGSQVPRDSGQREADGELSRQDLDADVEPGGQPGGAQQGGAKQGEAQPGGGQLSGGEYDDYMSGDLTGNAARDDQAIGAAIDELASDLSNRTDLSDVAEIAPVL